MMYFRTINESSSQPLSRSISQINPRTSANWPVHSLTAERIQVEMIVHSQLSLLAHSLNTVSTIVQTVLTATFNSYGDRQISTPYNISTPEPIEKKFITIDYVREGTPYTKFGKNAPTESFWANGWNNYNNYNKIYFYLFIPFFFDQPTGQTRDSSNKKIWWREITQRCAFSEL